MKHILKTINPYFSQVWKGVKTFEVRKNDRNFQPGDTLTLKEYDSEDDYYSGREIVTSVRYVLHGGKYGVEEGYCIMSLGPRYREDKEFTISKDDNHEFLQNQSSS